MRQNTECKHKNCEHELTHVTSVEANDITRLQGSADNDQKVAMQSQKSCVLF